MQKINKNKISKTLPTGNGNAKERKKHGQHWSKSSQWGLKFIDPLELSVKVTPLFTLSSILFFTPAIPLFQCHPQSKEIVIKSQYEMLKLSILMHKV
jgi:hypothetical protein